MNKKFPIAEIFGPTIQGEGLEQGIPCHFVRFGGCDFRCEWCDTPHAVLPQNVRHLPRMDTNEILDALDALTGDPEWVVLSGGNPALHDAHDLIRALHRRGKRIAVETQGTKFKPWLNEVDSLCVSPKPPSSGMKYTLRDLIEFLEKTPIGDKKGSYESGWWTGRLFIKIVIFDHADYEWAKSIFLGVNEETGGVGLPCLVSAGNDAGQTVGNPSRKDTREDSKIKEDLLSKARWLTNRVMVDKDIPFVRVQAQFHVLLWANELGR